MTADGKIAKDSNHFPDWTSREDKKFFAEISKGAGAVVMGDKTFNTFPAPLKDRLNVVFTLEKEPKEQEGVRWVSGDVKDVLKGLKDDGFTEVILGGGAFLNSVFLKENLIDEIILTIEPKIFGKGLGVFSEDFNIDLELKDFEKINNNSIVIRYKVKY